MLRRTLLATAALGLGMAFSGGAAMAAGMDKVKACFIYIGPIGDGGWTFAHDNGRKEIEKAFGDKVVTTFVEKVPESADAERVIRDMAAQGNKLIFGTTFGYMEPMLKVAADNKGIKFEHATGYKQAENMRTYDSRTYEGAYMAGVIAGKMTKSNILGYVAAFPIPEVLQGINAFTLGARSVNPKVDVRVIWVNSWYDPGKEREAAMTLIAQKADVVTHHTDSTAAVQAAEEKGVYACGYHSDMSKYGAKAHLTATTHHWGAYYTKIAQEVIGGTWKSGTIWGGMKDGFIKLAPINASVPQPVKDQVAKIETDIKAGTFHPFSGSVKDQSGKERLGAGKTMSDEDLGKMDYYVQGVTSKLPKS